MSDWQPLNLTNYAEHPTEPEWLVFRFTAEEQARQFEEALQSEGLRYERDADGGPPYLVAARKSDRERAVRFNYAVLGRHRAPFIANTALRWVVLAFVGLLLVLAAVGVAIKG